MPISILKHKLYFYNHNLYFYNHNLCFKTSTRLATCLKHG